MKTFQEFYSEVFNSAGLNESDDTFVPREVQTLLRQVVKDYNLDVKDEVVISGDVTAQRIGCGGIKLHSVVAEDYEERGEIVLNEMELTNLVKWLYDNDRGEVVDAGLPRDESGDYLWDWNEHAEERPADTSEEIPF